MDFHAVVSPAARLALRLCGQVRRSNASPLARASDFGGLEQLSEEAKHHHPFQTSEFFASGVAGPHTPLDFVYGIVGTHTPSFFT